MALRVLLVGRVFPAAICAYAADNGIGIINGPTYPSEQELIACIETNRPEALILRHGRLSAGVIAAAPSISTVVRHGVGLDAIDLEAACAAGITVCTTGLASSNAVAEHALALLLGTQRALLTHHVSMMEGDWTKTSAPLMEELRGSQVSVLGCGRVGSLLVRKLVALDAAVAVYDVRDVPVPTSVTVMPSLHEALRRASIVCITCSLNQSSRRMLDVSAIAALPPGAIIVNTARGEIVDLDAVRAALDRGHLAAYSTDVYEREPPTDGDVIRTREGPSIATPHVAACTTAAHHAMARRCIENLIALRDREPLPPDCLPDST